MKSHVTIAALALLAAETLVGAQGKDPAQVLADARKAMGGDKLVAVKTLSAEGRSLRTGPDGNTRENEFELSLALPDKYLMRSVVANLGNMSVYRLTGFNGGQAIEEIDRPPNLAGGNIVIRMAGPGGTTDDPTKLTPEEKAKRAADSLARNKKDFTRLSLGLFAQSLDTFPLTFTYAGEAESADGKADVIDVKGSDDFAVRLFVDQVTHLPLMLSWMDKEPISISMSTGSPAPAGGGAAPAPPPPPGGGGMVVHRFESGPPTSREDLEKRTKELEARLKEAEAKRRVVEFRVFYGDYQDVNGVKLPHRIQRSIDGKPTEELVFDTLKVNPKIDARIFQLSK